MNVSKWLYLGIQIKWWLLLLMVGVVAFSLGVACLLREAYDSFTFPSFVYYLTLQFLPQTARGVLFLLAGALVALTSTMRLSRSLLSPLLPAIGDDSLVDIVYAHQRLSHGPKVVAIGGGTGLSTLLRGLKEHTSNLTAIVTVADDGGSSGRLRRELGVLPPGDFRNCIVALANAEPIMSRLLQYRFNGGSGLDGHSFGNLFLVAMSGITGSFEAALRESTRVLAVRGQVLPSTLTNVTLCATTDEGELVRGESAIGRLSRRITQLSLQPEPVAYPEATRTILEADLIILGPGSLYTSLLPNLLVENIRWAVRKSSAVKIYVCNVATQPGETDGFTVADHVRALVQHAGPGLIQHVLANSNTDGPIDGKTEPVLVDQHNLGGLDVVLGDVVDEDKRVHHDPRKLAAQLMRTYYNRTTERTPSRENAVDREPATAVKI